MPAILNEGAYDAWLTARQGERPKSFCASTRPSTSRPTRSRTKADKVPKKDWLG